MDKLTVGETLDQYEEKEREMLILTLGGMGAMKLDNDLCQPIIDVIAYIDVESNELKKDRFRLCWIADYEPRYEWIHNLKRRSFYRITCRRFKEEYRNPRIKKDVYFLTSVLERDISDPRLEKALEEWDEPKYINILNLKRLKLDKRFGFYEKNVKFADQKFKLYLECSRTDRENAEAAIKAFEEIYANFEEWNQKIKARAARFMTDRANDWSRVKKITEQEFASRIKIREMTVNEKGGYTLSCSDDGMFGRHRIHIEGKDIHSVDNAHL